MAVLNVGTGALETKTYEQTTMSTLATETTEGNDLWFFLVSNWYVGYALCVFWIYARIELDIRYFYVDRSQCSTRVLTLLYGRPANHVKIAKFWAEGAECQNHWTNWQKIWVGNHVGNDSPYAKT